MNTENSDDIIDTTGTAVGWAKAFYSRAGERWGPSRVLPHHLERAEGVSMLCGPGSKRILELGAGAGGTAAALADLGHDVTALDIAPPRVAYARELAKEQRRGTLTVLEGDFFDPALALGRFDVVACWDSFGIGTDTDQRRLLERIGSEWLVPEGSVLLDVFNPVPWLRIAGQQQQVETDRAGTFIQSRDFDPIGCRFLDSWQAEGDKSGPMDTQSIRCNSPADFLLLLEGTGLAVCHAEVGGKPFDIHSRGSVRGAFGDAWIYHVVLKT